MFWACVVRRVQVHVGHAQGPCCETCQGLMLWDVVWAHSVGRNLGLCCETCSELIDVQMERIIMQGAITCTRHEKGDC